MGIRVRASQQSGAGKARRERNRPSALRSFLSLARWARWVASSRATRSGTLCSALRAIMEFFVRISVRLEASRGAEAKFLNRARRRALNKVPLQVAIKSRQPRPSGEGKDRMGDRTAKRSAQHRATERGSSQKKRRRPICLDGRRYGSRRDVSTSSGDGDDLRRHRHGLTNVEPNGYMFSRCR